MSWWGKLLGGTFGFMMGGPLGAMLGAAFGHQFDRGIEGAAYAMGGGSDHEQVQTAFFTALFSVMGHVAKADGRVSEHEISMARQVMRDMQLNEQQQKLAIDLFNQGKQADFPLEEVLLQFRQICSRRRVLLQMYLEILVMAAFADGVLHADERRLLRHIAGSVGFPLHSFESLVARMEARQGFHQGGSAARARPTVDRVAEACRMLGITKSASNDEVKRAYRRLMNQHHPDKLVARGMPEEMIKLATEKTQEIKAAYELVMQSRN